ncbi:MAG TPA: alpha/beta hydrolase [Bryobacteraceae bacterium]|nr:alpha/beta hydrolase [Bryobacteraceae bacterium]
MTSILNARRVFLALACSLTPGLFAQGQLLKAPTDVKAGSITYEEVEYPYPVSYLPLTLYGQDVRMAYMDVKPAGRANGRTAVLLHGMNFGGFYFSGPIELLRNEGFRVVVPDQIGFGRSSKPIIPYNWNDLAANTRKLLQTLGVSKAVIIGHSGGGMLAARFAASYPDITERVVLYNPIGLTDTRYERPWQTADETYKRTMAESQDQLYTQDSATIHRYFHTPGAWKPEYEKYVRILYAPTLSADWPRLAMVRTLLGQMVYQDPVVYDWAKIKVKALVLGGAEDTPDFPERAKHIADTIPGAELALLPGLGHVPHLQAPEVFNAALLKFLREDAPHIGTR